jgi:hypothetical protein
VRVADHSPWESIGIEPTRVAGAGLAVQVIGRMNPLIFQPAWFQRVGLLDAAGFAEAVGAALSRLHWM